MDAEQHLTGRDLAIRAEHADTLAWLDLYEAAPATLTEGLDLRSTRQGALVMVRSHVPFSHFNMVLTLGCPAPVDDAAFAAIGRFYGEATRCVLVNDFSEPSDLAAQLVSRGYTPSSVWDRVTLQGTPRDRWAPSAVGCERVDAANGTDWSEFVRGCYDMPAAIGGWLRALIGRPGWIHFIRRADGRAGAPVVMARSAFVDPGGWCWLGIDAPVPGVMADCFDDDRHVTAALVTSAADAGARAFVSDIEAVTRDRQGRGYAMWSALGFACVYRRRLFRAPAALAIRRCAPPGRSCPATCWS